MTDTPLPGMPVPPDTTAQASVVEALTTAQRAMLAALNGPEDEYAHRVIAACGSVSVAFLMDALTTHAPGAADRVARDLNDLLAVASGIGPWIYEQLEAHGVDPKSIAAFVPMRHRASEELRAQLAAYQPAHAGRGGKIGPPLWQHECGNIEAFLPDALPDILGGCDACESGSINPNDWQPLYRNDTGADTPQMWLVWSDANGAWWGPGGCGYRANARKAGRYTYDDAVKACGMRTWPADRRTPPEVMIPCPSTRLLGLENADQLLQKMIHQATNQAIENRDLRTAVGDSCA